MKKLMFFAVAALALASCSKETTMQQENLVQNEIAVNAFSKPNTKGYVTQTTFGDITAPAGDNDAPFTGDKYREMQISAFNETDKNDYFMGKTFATTDGKVWHATPEKIYWPLGKTLSFLAYSVNTSNKGVSATWDGAKKVSLEVTKDASQDDILFGAANNLNAHSSTSDQGFSMVFDHAQSWLTITVKVDNHSAKDVLKINAIEWTNTYNSGVLNIENNGTKAVAAWNFFTQTPGNVKMDDKTITNPTGSSTTPEYYEYSKYITKDIQVMDMLVPAQSHEGFVIKYVMNGIEGELPVATSEFTNTGDTWEMGKHYTYNLTFTVNEITVAPIVTVWDDEDLSYYYPSVESIVKTAAECVSALDGVTFTKTPLTVEVTTDKFAFKSNSTDVNDNKVFKALKQFCDGLAPVDKIKFDGKEFTWNEGLKYWANEGFSLEATIAKTAFGELGGTLNDDGTPNYENINNGSWNGEISLFYADKKNDEGEEISTDVTLKITIATPES